MNTTLKRINPRDNSFLVPRPVPEETGLFQVDATWGTIQPIQLAEGVRTVGEVEVLAHLAQDLPVIDSRTTNFYVTATIPGAKNIPYPDAVKRMAELDPTQETVFFCNGPQCGQSPTTIRALLDAGYPANKILYYRGGIHDWMTLGLPVVQGL